MIAFALNQATSSTDPLTWNKDIFYSTIRAEQTPSTAGIDFLNRVASLGVTPELRRQVPFRVMTHCLPETIELMKSKLTSLNFEGLEGGISAITPNQYLIFRYRKDIVPEKELLDLITNDVKCVSFLESHLLRTFDDPMWRNIALCEGVSQEDMRGTDSTFNTRRHAFPPDLLARYMLKSLTKAVQ